MSTTCGCGRPVADQAYACARCSAGLAQDLGDVAALTTTLKPWPRFTEGEHKGKRRPLRGPDRAAGVEAETLGWPSTPWDRPAGQTGNLSAEATVSATRQSRIGGGAGIVARTHDKPVPWDEKASDALDELRQLLTRTAVTVATTRGWVLDSGVTAGRLAAWLLEHVEWIRHRPEAGQTIADIGAAVEKVRRAVDRAPERWYAGPCGAVIDSRGVECTEHLYAKPGAREVRCPVCGTTDDVAARREWLLSAAENVLAHAGLISAALTQLDEPVTAAQIWALADRGRIVNHGKDAQGRLLFRVGDVRDVLAQQRQQRAARHNRKEAS